MIKNIIFPFSFFLFIQHLRIGRGRARWRWLKCTPSTESYAKFHDGWEEFWKMSVSWGLRMILTLGASDTTGNGLWISISLLQSKDISASSWFENHKERSVLFFDPVNGIILSPELIFIPSSCLCPEIFRQNLSV